MKTRRLIVRTEQDVKNCLQEIAGNMSAYLQQQTSLVTEVLIDFKLFAEKPAELESFISKINNSSPGVRYIFLENLPDEYLDKIRKSFENKLQIIISNCVPDNLSPDSLEMVTMQDILIEKFQEFFQGVSKQSYERFIKIFLENLDGYAERCVGCYFDFAKRSMCYGADSEKYAVNLVKEIVVEFLCDPIHARLFDKYLKLFVRQQKMLGISNFFVSDAEKKIKDFFESFNNKASRSIKIKMLLEDQTCSRYLYPPSLLLESDILNEKLDNLFDFSVCERSLKKAESSVEIKKKSGTGKPQLQRCDTTYEQLPGFSKR